MGAVDVLDAVGAVGVIGAGGAEVGAVGAAGASVDAYGVDVYRRLWRLQMELQDSVTI